MRPNNRSIYLVFPIVLSFNASAAMTVKYQHTDVLGSLIAETDSNGHIIQKTHYQAYGEQIGGQKAGIGYTGHLEDTDLGLTYMQQRYYDPEIGRFYSNDPVGFSASNPMMFNRYAYANNNPYKFVDPDGRETNPVSGKSGISDSQLRTNSTNASIGKYGNTRDESNWNKGNHNGVDIAAAKGTKLVAPIGGTVTTVSADKNPKGGNAIFIEKVENGKTIKIGMAHLDSISATNNSTVTEGEEVGTSGTTGNADGLPQDEQHVHLSVRVNGETVDPQTHFAENPSSTEEKK
jgi:RHS repeat-associated protein